MEGGAVRKYSGVCLDGSLFEVFGGKRCLFKMGVLYVCNPLLFVP